MINRFNEFLIESLILESKVVYSDKFKKILNSMSGPVATTLKEIESEDLDVQSNYFDIISNDKEQLSFIADRRASQIVSNAETEITVTYNDAPAMVNNPSTNGRIFTELGFTPPESGSLYKPENGTEGKIISSYTSPTSGNTYVMVEFPEGRSVFNKSRLTLNDPLEKLWTSNRQPIRIGRAVRALLRSANVTHSDSEIEKFVNDYKSEHDKMNDIFSMFEIVKGKDIGYWYNRRNYLRTSGPLGGSCMSDVPSSYFQIYMYNDTCSLLILKDRENPDKIRGRALVWKLYRPMEITFVDRAYCFQDSDVDLFKKYAQHMGFYSKYYNDNGNWTSMIDPNGQEVDKGHLYVKITPHREYDNYPYLDTLKYLNESEGFLTTNSDDKEYILEDTEGGHSGRSGSCDTCGGSELVTCYECDGDGEISCGECDGDGKIECDTCDGKGHIDCDTCDSSGEVECDTCDGSGEVDGEECEDCEGSGNISCEDCSGEGKSECSDCDGKGEEECDECGGSGLVTCSHCDGDGEVACPDCDW
jgi:hypothetical protein